MIVLFSFLWKVGTAHEFLKIMKIIQLYSEFFFFSEAFGFRMTILKNNYKTLEVFRDDIVQMVNEMEPYGTAFQVLNKISKQEFFYDSTKNMVVILFFYIYVF